MYKKEGRNKQKHFIFFPNRKETYLKKEMVIHIYIYVQKKTQAKTVYKLSK